MRPALPCWLPILLMLTGLVLAGPASAEDASNGPDENERVYPYQCERWEAMIERMQDADDAVARELGELYGLPEHRWCQTRRVRVPPERDSNWDFDFNLPGLAGLAQLLRLLAILGLVALVIWALWKLQRHFYGLPGSNARSESHDLDQPGREAIIQPETLPDDVPGAARELWQQGRQREAVGLLYRAAVDRLLGDGRRGESRTEREVLRLLRVQGTTADTLAWMKRLVSLWQYTAWAGQAADTAGFEALADEWMQHCPKPRRQTQ